MAKIIFLIILFMAQSAVAATVPLKDRNNHTFGYLDQGKGMRAIRNKSRHIIGYVDNNGTYDASRHKIARYPLPGLLFGDKFKHKK